MLISMLIATFMGSSPRVRGKQDVIREAVKMAGLIPACAGKTYRGLEAVRGMWAHPRVCGENQTRSFGLWTLWGSSPRVRGKHRLGCFAFVNSGLIPACAGKTLRESRAHAKPQAHPRVCGENGSSV